MDTEDTGVLPPEQLPSVPEELKDPEEIYVLSPNTSEEAVTSTVASPEPESVSEIPETNNRTEEDSPQTSR